MPVRFVADKHIDPEMIRAEIGTGPVTPAAEYRPKRRYLGEEPQDEDRNHVLQLAFERDATAITADGGILNKAYNFGPCGSNNNVLGGVIVLPKGKDAQIAALRAFKGGSLPVLGVDPGDFETIWRDNLGVDLRRKAPKAIDLCDCPLDTDVQQHDKRYGRK